jgi:outer membrane lipoprotein carrier protein
MSRLFTLIFFITSLYANLDLHSFSSPFEQKVTDDQNKTIRYEGEVYFLAPNLTKWVYKKPIKKTILFDGHNLILIEPELEQVTITDFKKEQNLLSLLKKAKPCGKDRYCLSIDKKEFTVFVKNGTITRIEYKDELANSVEIRFLDPKQNLKIDEKIFEVKIPAGYDRIYR